MEWNRTPGALYAAAPALGQHNDYVLREFLGKSEQQVQALRDAGVLETTPEDVRKQRGAQQQAQARSSTQD